MAPRVPRKKGQTAKSKKHSDLYTDEDHLEQAPLLPEDYRDWSK